MQLWRLCVGWFSYQFSDRYLLRAELRPRRPGFLIKGFSALRIGACFDGELIRKRDKKNSRNGRLWNGRYWRAKRTFGLGVVAESLGLSGGDLLELEPARPARAGFFVDAVEVQVVPEA